MAGHITYDPEADAVAIVFSDGPSEGEEVYPGVMLHLDDQNRIVEIEILAARTKSATGALDGLPLPGEPEKATVRVRADRRRADPNFAHQRPPGAAAGRARAGMSWPAP